MPVRSLTSSIMKWPSRDDVHAAFEQWTESLKYIAESSAVLSVGYFGSYARGDFGVGSDLDVVILLAESSEPFECRANAWDFYSIPVPVEAQVYTLEEWQRLPERLPRFYRTLMKETCWLLNPQIASNEDVERGNEC